MTMDFRLYNTLTRRKEVFKPLKMKDTSFLPPDEWLPRIAPTEQRSGEMLRGKVHDPKSSKMGGVAGHAGLFTTAADIARFARMMLAGGELDGVRVFKPETVKLMTSVQSPPGIAAHRGLGWDIDTGYSRRGALFPPDLSYGHTGFTGTSVWIDPYSQSFVVFMSNRVHPDGRGNVLSLQSTLSTLAAESLLGVVRRARLHAGVRILLANISSTPGGRAGSRLSRCRRDRHRTHRRRRCRVHGGRCTRDLAGMGNWACARRCRLPCVPSVTTGLSGPF